MIPIEEIRKVLERQPPLGMTVHSGALLRRAAVLVPLVPHNGDWHLLFTRRTEIVQDHKGQVSFPGGAVDPDDQSCENTALREANEEVGIPKEQVNILGRLPKMRTITEYIITPVVGVIPWPFDFKISPDEVDRVFTIPLDWLADERNREEKIIMMRNAHQEKLVIYKPYDGEVLWGITARLTLNFLRLLDLTD